MVWIYKLILFDLPVFGQIRVALEVERLDAERDTFDNLPRYLGTYALPVKKNNHHSYYY